MYIAAHYGQTALFDYLLTIGVRPDEPIGAHPCRQWMASSTSTETNDSQFIRRLRHEQLRAPVHEAILNG